VGSDGTCLKDNGEQVGVQVSVSDESGELLGLEHQICRGHVKHNVDELTDSIGKQAKS
jgi:hypothetical protein